jgi:hypothetical protein
MLIYKQYFINLSYNLNINQKEPYSSEKSSIVSPEDGLEGSKHVVVRQ